MQVIDLTGRIVYSENSVSEHGANGKFYDFSDLSKGVYVFKIIIGDHTQTERIIIQ